MSNNDPLSKERMEQFYSMWEDLVSEMSDDLLETTFIMINQHNEINHMIRDEYGYRNGMM